MKKLIFAAFIFTACTIFAKHNEYTLTDPLKDFREKKSIEYLTADQKDKLLILRREYFRELKDIQEKVRELRKEANECMMNNDEKRYEEIHDVMNELKLKRELVKENYREQIDGDFRTKKLKKSLQRKINFQCRGFIFLISYFIINKTYIFPKSRI